MMYRGTNKTALKSQKRILDATFLLLENEDYGNITVKNICSQARISRQRFYYLFESKDEVLIYYINDFFEKHEKFIYDNQVTSIYDLIYYYFSAVNNDANMRKLIHINSMMPVFMDIMLKFMANMHVIKTNRQAERDDCYAHYFASSGLNGIFLYWLERNKEISLKNLVLIVENILRGKVFE